MSRRLFPALLLLLAACAAPEPVVPVAARVAGAELQVTLSDGQVCGFVLPEARRGDLTAPPDCPILQSVSVYPFEPGSGLDVTIAFQGEGPLANDGAPLSVWIGTEYGSYRFRG